MRLETKFILIAALLFMLSFLAVSAQEYNPENSTDSQANQTTNLTTEPEYNSQSGTSDSTDSKLPDQTSNQEDQTKQEQQESQEDTKISYQKDGQELAEKENPEFDILGITPGTARPGDVLLNIIVKNTGNVMLENIIPLIVARGFSSYDAVPIKSLKPGDTETAIVAGRFSEEGEIIITIKINGEIFYRKITISEPEDSAISSEELAAQESAKKAALKDLSRQLEALKKKYNLLEQEFEQKKSRYDTSNVKLDDLKKYLVSAKSTILTEEVEKTNVTLIIALNEYNDQKENLENATKKSIVTKLKENALIISAIAGAILTTFTLIEVLRKKKEGVYQKIKEFKINHNTKVVVEKKSPSKPSKAKGKKRKPKAEKKAPKKEEQKQEEPSENKKEEQKKKESDPETAKAN